MRKIYSYLFILLSIVLWECASVKAPPGGPVDETAPQIISISPPSGTTNLSKSNIRIKFSEYMDENSFNKNIVIFPRLEDPLKYKFKGDRIELNLPKQLDSTITYIIQLNRNIKDEHGVALAKTEHIAYSTGSSISRGVISGKIYSNDAASIHLWKINNISVDSIFASQPNYLTDADDEGNYSFEYLSEGNYKILAVDKNGADQPLNTARSQYGLFWSSDIILTNNDTLKNINMRLWKEPQKLALLRGEWSAFSWGTLYFNYTLPDIFNLSMDLIQNDIPLNYNYYFNGIDSTSLIVNTTDSLFAKSLTVNINSLSHKNKVLLDSFKLDIQIPQKTDTTYLQILSPQMNAAIIPEHYDGDQIDLIFSKPANILPEASITVQMFDKDSIKMPINIERMSPIYYQILPVKPWTENTRYNLKFFNDGIAVNEGRGLKDSLRVIGISTKNRMGYGGVIGSVKPNDKTKLMVELFSVKNPSLSHIADVNSKSQFEFKTIPEGEYSLCFFEDRDNDMKYSFGKAYQLEPSEWFYFYPDTFEVRANWDSEILPVDIGESE